MMTCCSRLERALRRARHRSLRNMPVSMCFRVAEQLRTEAHSRSDLRMARRLYHSIVRAGKIPKRTITPWREFSALGRAPLKMDVTGFFHERKYKYSRVSRAPSRDLGILAHSACLLRFHARRSRGVHDSLSRTQFAFQPAAQIDVASSAASHFSGRRCN